MQVYTNSEARQKLGKGLKESESKGKGVVRRKDGQTFTLVPENTTNSPLSVLLLRYFKARDSKNNEKGHTTG